MPNYTNRKLYNRVNALERKVKQEAEVRYFDQLQIASVSTTGNVVLLNGLTQGDQGFQREGDWVTNKKLKVKGNMVAGDTTQIMRVMIIADWQSNGVAPTIAQILDISIITPPTLAYRNMEYVERFTVLHDEFYSLVTGADTQQRLFSINLNLNIKTNYSLGTAGTIADISRGAIFLILLSDSNAASHPGMNVGSRLKFIA